MRARGWPLALGLALCVMGAVPIDGADEPPPAVVARDGGVELDAADREEHLCLAVRDPQAARFETSGCGDGRDGVATPPTSPAGGPAYVGVAAPAAATSVEVRRLGKVVGRAATVPGDAYNGAAAGAVRFALVRVAEGTRPSGLRVHAKDAAGALVAVLDSGGERIAERRRLLSGRAGRVRWSLHEQRTSALDPAAFDLAREGISRCVTREIRATADRADEFGSGSVACTRGLPTEELILDSDFTQAREADRCTPGFRLMHGIVGASVRRVTVVLGDGRRSRAPTAALRGGTRRAWALAVAASDAVRAVVIESAAARRTLAQRRAPVAVGCAIHDDNSGLTDYFFGFGDGLPPVPVGAGTAITGPPAFRVADGPADTLCLALGDEPFTAVGCKVVAPSLSEPHRLMDDDIDPRVAVFAVPTRVAVVRLSSTIGATALDIPTVVADGYSGRYAGSVRFATARLPRYYDLPRLELFDAAGKLLVRKDEHRTNPRDAERRGFAPRRVAGAVGAPSLWQARSTLAGETLRCLTLTPGPPPSDDEPCGAYRSRETVLLDASCATHRLTIAVAVRPGTRVLADIGAAAPRRVRLHDGAGLLTLRPGSPLRSVTFIRKSGARRVRLDAPPARASAVGARRRTWRRDEGEAVAPRRRPRGGSRGRRSAHAEDGDAGVDVARDGDIELVVGDEAGDVCVGLRVGEDLQSQGCGDETSRARRAGERSRTLPSATSGSRRLLARRASRYAAAGRSSVPSRPSRARSTRGARPGCCASPWSGWRAGRARAACGCTSRTPPAD